MKPEIIKLPESDLNIEEYGLEKETATSIEKSFLPFFKQAKEWREKAESLVVNDVNQVEEMKQARKARLALKNIRVEADKTRKALKADSIKYGKAVQGVYNVIDYLISPIEKHLAEQEKFAEIQEAKRKAEVKAKREIELTPYEEFVPVQIDLGEMIEEDYQKLLAGAKLQFEAKIEAKRKAEQERIEREEKEAIYKKRRTQLVPFYQFGILDKLTTETSKDDFEALLKNGIDAEIKYKDQQAAIQAENEKLRKEREEAAIKAKIAEKKAAAERAVVEAKAKAEQEAREKLEAEIKAKKEAEEKKAREELAVKKKAELAPDKEKLLLFAKQLKYISTPSVSSEEASKILASVKELIAKTVKYTIEQTEKKL